MALAVARPETSVRMLPVKAVADAYSVNWRTALRWAQSGLIPPGIKVGGRRLFRSDQIEEHIRSGCPKVRQ
jgi:predicted site-specific integrase-resolvase